MIRIIVAILLLSSLSHARGGSTTAGDGGLTVWCNGATVELLDFAEARRLSNLNPVLTSALLTVRKKELPTEFRDLDARANRIRGELKLVDQAPPSRDWGIETDHSVFSSCTFWQLGYKWKNELLVSRELYNLLPQSERYAFLVHEALHEIIYDKTDRIRAAAAARQVLIYLSADDGFRSLYRSRVNQIIREKRPLDWSLYRNSAL